MGQVEGLIGFLEHRRGQDGTYIGCMKSGDVIADEYELYHPIFTIKCMWMYEFYCPTSV